MISAETEVDKKGFARWRKEFGESSDQALVRLGVTTARELAILTQPTGKSKKASMRAIEAGARANIAWVSPRIFRNLEKQDKPRFEFRGRWGPLRRNQILRNGSQIHSFIERARNNKGRTRELARTEMAVAKKTDLNRVIRERKKLAGIAKGSWLGAGISLSRRSRGPEKATIGKNVLAWTRKHVKQGSSRFRGSGARLTNASAELISRAPHTKRHAVTSPADVREAIRRGWSKSMLWYRRAARRANK